MPSTSVQRGALDAPWLSPTDRHDGDDAGPWQQPSRQPKPTRLASRREPSRGQGAASPSSRCRPRPINWADDALADAPWEPAQALEAPPLSPAIPKQPPVDLRIEATLANATVKQTTISAIIGGGCCGYVAGWCLLSSLVRLGTVAGATTAGLLVVLPPPPLAANTLWFDVDGDPRRNSETHSLLVG